MQLQAAFDNCKLQSQAASSELQTQAIYGMSFQNCMLGLDHPRPSRNVPCCGIPRFYTQPYGAVYGSLKSSVYRVARICVTPILHRDATALATYPVVEFKWPVVAWVLHHG